MQLDRVDQLFRAFADETRLRILNVLRDGELCVGDLVRVLETPQPTASRHLAQLRDAGLVSTRRQGLWCFYRLAEAEGRFHQRLLGCLASCFEEVPELAADLAAARDLRARGGCCPESAASPARRRPRKLRRPAREPVGSAVRASRPRGATLRRKR